MSGKALDDLDDFFAAEAVVVANSMSSRVRAITAPRWGARHGDLFYRRALLMLHDARRGASCW
jgi:hypothetical protein